MQRNEIILNKKRNVYLETYLLSNSAELMADLKRPIIVICPGGGYKNLSDREAEPIALAYNAAGFHAVVLRYGVDEHAIMPGPIEDLAYAVDLIHSNADNYYIDKNNIFIAGFSAGGHLAASLAVFWNDENILPEYKRKGHIKPKGVILGYPVIDLKSTSTFLDIGIKDNQSLETINFDMLHPSLKPEQVFVRKEGKLYVNFEIAMNAYMFGGLATEQQIYDYSLQNHVSDKCCPAFIWHGAEDELILPQNSLKFATVMHEQGVNCELHIYASGGHGLALGSKVTSNHPWELVPEVQNWMEMSITWINNQIEKNLC